MRSGVGVVAIDDGVDLGDDVGGEAALEGVAADDLFVGCDVDAVDLVGGDERSEPLYFGVDASEGAAGAFGDGDELLSCEVTGSGDVAFDQKFWHD